MEDLTGSLKTETVVDKEITEGQGAGDQSAVSAGGTILEGGQQATQNSGTVSGWDYKTDPRWGKIWKQESDIIQGYKSLDDILEKKYKPTFKQYEDLQKKFKDSGIEFDKIDDYIKEYQTLKSPEHPTNQVYGYLKELVEGDDIAAEDLQKAIDQINEQKLLRKYPGLTDEARAKIIAQEKKLKELETWKGQIETDKLNAERSSLFEKNAETIKNIASSRGLDFTDEIRNEFLNHCIKNQVPVHYMVQEFRNKYDEMMDKLHEEKIKAQILESQNKTNKTQIPVKGKTTLKSTKAENLEEGLRQIFGKKK
jgi:hypothetical protein